MASGLGLGLTQRQPSTTGGGGFQFASSSSSAASSPLPSNMVFDLGNNGDDPDAPLPFPTALPRRDFLAPDFNAVEYLSSLFPGSSSDEGLGAAQHRHQTLEDLRTELRERSSAISAELLELVNANYTSFLGLGDELKGGEERVEDVRVALLGFRRQVEEIQNRVRGRREDVQRVGKDLRGVRGDVEAGRRMLELDERTEVLLGRLEEGYQDDSDEEEEEEGTTFTGCSPDLLTELAKEYLAIDKLADAIGRDVPYVKKMEERITRCRNTLLLDLGTSTKEARKAGRKGQDRVLKLLEVYRLLGAYSEGVKILKEK